MAVDDRGVTSRNLESRSSLSLASQIIGYIFFLVYGVIGLRIILELFGARENSAFKQFLDAVTRPLLLPFEGLMPDPAVGPFRFRTSYFIALIVYALLHMAIRGLLRLFASSRTAV